MWKPPLLKRNPSLQSMSINKNPSTHNTSMNHPPRSYHRQSFPTDRQRSIPRANQYLTPMETKRGNIDPSTQRTDDLIKVLQEQNSNLKQQNMFLISKLRIVTERQEELRKTARENQEREKTLKIENEELRREIMYVNEVTNKKVQEFGNKINQLTLSSKQTEHQISDYLPESDTQLKEVEEMGREQKQVLQRLNCQFQQMLYWCKMQQDLRKKKEYRKQLVELTHKMRELRKGS